MTSDILDLEKSHLLQLTFLHIFSIPGNSPARVSLIDQKDSASHSYRPLRENSLKLKRCGEILALMRFAFNFLNWKT